MKGEKMKMQKPVDVYDLPGTRMMDMGKRMVMDGKEMKSMVKDPSMVKIANKMMGIGKVMMAKGSDNLMAKSSSNGRKKK